MEESTNKAKPSKLKDKKIISILIIVLVVIILIIGSVFILNNRSSEIKDSSNPLLEDSSSLPVIDTDEIGMVVTLREDGQALMFELTKASDIELVEYTIEYEKDIDGEIVPEGIFGLMAIGEDGITKTDFRPFGTCSAGRCRYDDVVSDVTIILKITKTNGSEFQAKKIVELK